jgi:hypothetical protein
MLPYIVNGVSCEQKAWDVAVPKNREREADEKRVQSQPTRYRCDPIYEAKNNLPDARTPRDVKI